MKVKDLRKLIKEVLNEMENQVIDVDTTLRALQSKVKSGSEVTIEGKPVFKMPMINLATFIGGGKIILPRDGERLKLMANNILIDGEPLELLYKDAPKPIPSVEKTPEEIEAAKQAWQDRYGPGGGYDTPFGRYTGD